MMTTAPLSNRVPSHVDPKLVYDFDFAEDPLLCDPSSRGDLHNGLLKLNQRAPEIFYSPHYGGAWFVRSYEAAFEITHDPALFSNGGSGYKPLPIASDPPEHEAYRGALLQIFSPKNINAMLPVIQSMAIELVGNVVDRGECEFVAEVAEPMPVVVFMKMLGLPLALMPPLRKLIVAYLSEGDPAKRDGYRIEMLELLDPVIEARLEKREKDMLSHLIDSDLDGRRPTLDEIRRYLWFLATAGLDTVVNAMSFSVMHLAKDLDLQGQLRADPALIPNAIEEFLRRYAPSTVIRTVTRDVEFRGVSMRRGDLVMVLLPAANLDETYYPEPDRIILHRESPAVTFGTGIHRCLGSHLARLEMRILLIEWLSRVPEFALDDDNPPQSVPGLVYGVNSLNLRWKPERKASDA